MTDTIHVTDSEHKLTLTLHWAYACSTDSAAMTFDADYDQLQLKECAVGAEGAKLLLASHLRERKDNSHRDSAGNGHPDWIIIGRINYGGNAAANWFKLQLVCDAKKRRGEALPSSCKLGGTVS